MTGPDDVTVSHKEASVGQVAISEKSTEINVAADGTVIDHGLHRALKQRHLQMIALGGVIGASIWYGTGLCISYSGPVGKQAVHYQSFSDTSGRLEPSSASSLLA
jgi:amino acid permease